PLPGRGRGGLRAHAHAGDRRPPAAARLQPGRRLPGRPRRRRGAPAPRPLVVRVELAPGDPAPGASPRALGRRARGRGGAGLGAGPAAPVVAPAAPSWPTGANGWSSRWRPRGPARAGPPAGDAARRPPPAPALG